MKRLLLIVLCMLIFLWTPCQSAENVQLARMNPWVAGSVTATSAKQSTDALTVYLNGSQEISITNYTSTGVFIGPDFGTSADSRREGNSIVQYDNISISSSALTGGCNQ